MTDSPKLKVIHGHAYASSLDIARHFRKNHNHVLRDIENLISLSNFGQSDSFSLLNFEESTYKDSRGKSQPCYNMTRDGFALLAMGFTGREALVWKIKFLTAFNEMEAELQRRNLKAGRIEQMNLFPSLERTIAETADRPSLSVTAVLTVIAYEGLMIPIVTRDQIVRMIKRGRLEGFNDGRNWQVYQDSFDSFLRHRRTSLAKVA